MAKRFLNLTPTELISLSKQDLIDSIAHAEGRVIAAETIGAWQPFLMDVTNAELSATFGADIIILNIFNVNKPVIQALPECDPKDTVRKVKELIGRPVGINLEPIPEEILNNLDAGEDIWGIDKGVLANAENARKAKEMGVDFINITGNPGHGVKNDAIVRAIKEIREALGDEIAIIAGKMHASGVISEGGENIITKDDVKQFIDAGADIILMPAPGTVPGISVEYLGELIAYAHSFNKLVMTSIGTSQEGSDTETIKRIAYNAKMAGADIHHIGDSGYNGGSLPENIMAYSIVIRGIRHTYHRMAQSIRR